MKGFVDNIYSSVYLMTFISDFIYIFTLFRVNFVILFQLIDISQFFTSAYHWLLLLRFNYRFYNSIFTKLVIFT